MAHVQPTGLPTYDEYLAHAKAKGFQPLGQVAFQKLAAAGFDPIRNKFLSDEERSPDSRAQPKSES